MEKLSHRGVKSQSSEIRVGMRNRKGLTLDLCTVMEPTQLVLQKLLG